MAVKNYILIKNIKVQNANALSSAFTIGFPAVTSFMGFMHGIQRKINSYENFSNVEFESLIICCHKFRIHSYKLKYKNRLVLTRNPLKKNNKTGEWTSPPFIEEGRCNFTISLIIKLEKIINPEKKNELEKIISSNLLQKMKIAGGDILSFENVDCRKIDSDSDLDNKKLMLSLMPGYVLVERRNLVEKTMIDEK